MKIATNETSTGFLMQYSKFKYIATRIFLQKILHQRTKPGHASFWMYKSRIHITYKVHLLQTVRAFLQKLQSDCLNIIPSHRWAPALRRSHIPRFHASIPFTLTSSITFLTLFLYGAIPLRISVICRFFLCYPQPAYTAVCFRKLFQNNL